MIPLPPFPRRGPGDRERSFPQSQPLADLQFQRINERIEQLQLVDGNAVVTRDPGQGFAGFHLVPFGDFIAGAAGELRGGLGGLSRCAGQGGCAPLCVGDGGSRVVRGAGVAAGRDSRRGENDDIQEHCPGWLPGSVAGHQGPPAYVVSCRDAIADWKAAGRGKPAPVMAFGVHCGLPIAAQWLE